MCHHAPLSLILSGPRSNQPAAAMATGSLDSLPFDVFYQIATLLDDRDCINLSRTSRALHEFMQSELIAHKTVEVSLIRKAHFV